MADGTPFFLTCIRVARPPLATFSLSIAHTNLDIIALALDLQRPGLVQRPHTYLP